MFQAKHQTQTKYLSNMKLQELIISVNEKKLSREQLEKYSDQLSMLFAQMMLEMAELEKEEALFLGKESEKSVAQRKIEWKITKSGQRLIELKRYSLSIKEMLRSLKSRIYQLIY